MKVMPASAQAWPNSAFLEGSFELPARTVEQFRQVLLDALNARDYEKLKSLMGPSFMIAYWQSEGFSGLVYWYGLFPAHLFIFDNMTRNICRLAEEQGFLAAG